MGSSWVVEGVGHLTGGDLEGDCTGRRIEDVMTAPSGLEETL